MRAAPKPLVVVVEDEVELAKLIAVHLERAGMQTQVCNVAQQAANRPPPGPSLSDVLGTSAALPEAQTAKKGGSTFDTLNGNVLTR